MGDREPGERQDLIGGVEDPFGDISEPRGGEFLDNVGEPTPKRTSLWKLDEDLLQVKLVEDLPGLGDTCFPALVQESDCTFMLYNYTSPLGGIDLPWLAGQHGPTQIYELQLKFDIADGDEPRS